MDAELILTILVRWVHIVCAIITVGGTLFMAVAFSPGVRAALGEDSQGDGSRQQLIDAVLGRWRRVFMPAIGLLLLTGLYNFIRFSIPRVKEQGLELYHPLFGVKFILAMAVFFLSSVLVGRAATFAPMRAKPGKWLALNALLALTVVLISAVLRNLGS